MAARDYYELKVSCDKCQVSGTVEVSEDDYPFQRGPGFRIEHVPDGFSVTGENEDRTGTTFHCDSCGAIVRVL